MAIEVTPDDETEHTPAYIAFRAQQKQANAAFWADYWRRKAAGETPATPEQAAATIAPDTHSGR